MQATRLPETPSALRDRFRKGELSGTTGGLAPGYVQANLVMLPREQAFDFLLFCQRNPKPCPLIEVVEAGSNEPRQSAPESDLRYDAPKYRVYRDGELEAEEQEISRYWRDDIVSFLLGCSFTFESAMLRAGIPLRHLEQDTVVPMYVTDIQTTPAGMFFGPMVVSMRPIPRDRLVKTVQTTSRFPAVHGSPVHIGDPAAIGIRDIDRPDMGQRSEVQEGEVPVFWACGVTPQAVVMESRPPLMITHSPGHMFITDLRDEELSVL